jgi:hypothetical protein
MFSKTTSVLTAKGAILFAAPGALFAPARSRRQERLERRARRPQVRRVAARLEHADEE